MIALLHWFLFWWGPAMGPLPFKSTEVEYAYVSEQKLGADIIRPADNNSYPGVLLVHGGSWTGRSREDMTQIGEFIASHGFVVMNISYRFAPKHRYPAQIEDMQLAFKFFKTNAEKFHLDSTRIGAWGYSAGGHIVTQWALLESERVKTPVLQAVVAGGTPFDLSWYPESPLITHLLDGFRDQRIKEYKEASPVNHVGPWAPPMFLYHGKTDILVEAVQSSNMQNRLRDAGVEARLCVIKYWGHLGAFLFTAEPLEKGVSFLKEKLK